MELVSKYYDFMYQLALSFGIDESVAGAVVILLSLLILGILLKLILPKKKFKSKNLQKTKTQLGSTQVPCQGGKTNFPSATEGRIAMRHFDRTETKLKVTYNTDLSPTPRECKIVDLSLSGLGFLCDEVLNRGTRVRFNLPNLNKNYKVKEFTVGGEIVRAAPSGRAYDYGIKFFHVFKRDEELLQLLIDKYK